MKIGKHPKAVGRLERRNQSKKHGTGANLLYSAGSYIADRRGRNPFVQCLEGQRAKREVLKQV